ncbi:MAG: hypothetical protein V4667_04115 [Bacteroidota bacterium]
MIKRVLFFSVCFFQIVLFSFGTNDSLKRKSLLISVTPNLTGLYRLIPGHALGVNSSVGVKIPINKKSNYSVSVGFWYAPVNKGFKNFEFQIRDSYIFNYFSLPFRYQRKTKFIEFNFELTPLLLLHQNMINNERKYNVNCSFDLSKSIKINKRQEITFGIGVLSRNLFSVYKRSLYGYSFSFSNPIFLRIEYLFNQK